MSGLETIFNFLALNLVFLLTSVVVVTLPLTIAATFTAFSHKRQRREDRLVREYIVALRSTTVRRTLLVNGVPLALIALGAEEVHYFAVGGAIVARFCFGLGLCALLVTATALGYVFLLERREPALDAINIWSAAAQIAVRNLLRTGPLLGRSHYRRLARFYRPIVVLAGTTEPSSLWHAPDGGIRPVQGDLKGRGGHRHSFMPVRVIPWMK